MREHEVPTHVQAEDRVLLWFTFPQVVAMTAVCALSYGVYRYAPVGPTEVRMGLAVIFGLVGITMVVGKLGGRRLPLVAADLLKYRLGPRRYMGLVSQLVRSKPPATVQSARSGPGPLGLMASRLRRTFNGLRRKRRKDPQRRNGRRPFRPQRWLGRGQRAVDTDANNTNEQQSIPPKGRGKNRRFWRKLLGAVVLAVLAVLAATVPQAAIAYGPGDGEGWSFPEIEFEIPEPVPGRRIFVEGLTVSGDTADVTVRAATDLDLNVRAYGGSRGESLGFWDSASLAEGETAEFALPLSGPRPSFTFSWEDNLQQAGAFALKHHQIPYPLPAVEGELCNITLASLGWTPWSIEGVVESQCEEEVKKTVALRTVSGHANVAEMALMDAEVTAITGTVAAVTRGSRTTVSFVPDGQTHFQLSVGEGKGLHTVTIVAEMKAALRIAIPPLTRLTHHPERTEHVTRTVSLLRPGTSKTVRKRVTIENSDGTISDHTISATLSIPSATVKREVTVSVLHPEHVRAEVVERNPVTRSRGEMLVLASTVGTDESYQVLDIPEREPVAPPAEQKPAETDLTYLFDYLGWEWPW